MKKIILVAVMMLGFAAAAIAQPKAVGIRNTEISYQHTLGDKFVQADLGILGGIGVTGTYNWTLLNPDWTKKGDWSVYAGPGAHIGLGGGLSAAVAGLVGVEYTFWFPLQLSLDLRPMVGVATGGDTINPIFGVGPAFGARYKF